MATAWFDEDYYLSGKLAQLQAAGFEEYETEEDVRAAIEDDAGMSLEEHFMLYGWNEGVLPSENFDELYFEAKLLHLQDVDPEGGWEDVDQIKEVFDDMGLTPLQHYGQYGQSEDVLGYLDDDDEGGDDDLPSEIKKLTVAHDDFTGDDAGADGHNTTFVANIQQNAMGNESNTLGTGDELDGGEGYNTLNAELIAGINIGGSSRPIKPITENVQEINLNAQHTSLLSQAFDVPVYVNARDMVDVEYLSSNYSDASLVIQNMTSEGVAGGTAGMTFGMIHTGNRDTHWQESDFTVLFDQDYLLPDADIEGRYFYDILNQKSYDADNDEPVKDFPLREVFFEINGDTEYEIEVTAEDMEGVLDHDDLVDKLNDLLEEQYPELEGFEFVVRGTFKDDDTRVSDRIELVYTGSEENIITDGGIGLDKKSGEGNLYWDRGPLEASEFRNPVTTNVELEKVGNAGDGGELVIGSMNKTGDAFEDDGYGGNNQWGAVNSNSNTEPGFDEFIVTVSGSNNESSSLSSIRSTNNTLRRVEVNTNEDQEGSYADLEIGNSNSWGAPLKDVQEFDASGLKGDLTLEAYITYETINKYLNNDDTIADNEGFIANEDGFVNFNYEGGSGDDFIYLDISASVINNSYRVNAYEIAGETVINPWDGVTDRAFDMEISGNDGDDEIIVQINGDPITDSVITDVPEHFEDVQGYDDGDLNFGGSWSGIWISGGAGDDVIDLTADDVTVFLLDENGDPVLSSNSDPIELDENGYLVDSDGTFVDHKGQSLGSAAEPYTFDDGQVLDSNGNPILDEDEEPLVFDSQVETDGWSFAVVFDQDVAKMSNGADTIYNFSAGEQTFTTEIQVLDVEGLVLHDGEEINIVINGETFTYKHSGGTLDDEDIANLSGNNFKNAEGDTLTAEYGNLTADSDETQILFVFDDLDAWEGDIDTITSSIANLNTTHRVSYDKQDVIEGPEAITLQHGGYAENGNDFLDFTHYDVDGISWEANWADGTTGNTGGYIAGDTIIRLTESTHKEGFYDIEHVTNYAQIDEDVELIGTVQFEDADGDGVSQAFDATNFIF